MRRFVTKVFLETWARIRIHDALGSPALGKRRAPRRELGVIEPEKMGNCVAIIEDVNLNRIIVEAGPIIETVFHVAASAAGSERRVGRRSSAGSRR